MAFSQTADISRQDVNCVMEVESHYLCRHKIRVRITPDPSVSFPAGWAHSLRCWRSSKPGAGRWWLRAYPARTGGSPGSSMWGPPRLCSPFVKCSSSRGQPLPRHQSRRSQRVLGLQGAVVGEEGASAFLNPACGRRQGWPGPQGCPAQEGQSQDWSPASSSCPITSPKKRPALPAVSGGPFRHPPLS